jgi:HAD superfamily hydrolase (TIGR01509 family)
VWKTRRREAATSDVSASPIVDAAGVEDLALDTIAIHWREALDDAEDALNDVSRSRKMLQFPAAELRDRTKELRSEREGAARDLERLARTTRLPLHRRLVGPRASSVLLGLGTGVRACIFDLDGVLTPSQSLHAAAWQGALDELLARHHDATGQHLGGWRPFGRRDDYARYLHGKPRIDGVHAFLASRGIRLPDGSPDDAPGTDTAFGVANRKNQMLVRRLRHEGVRAYEGSVLFLELAHEAELPCAVISASANTDSILRRAGILPLIDEVVDGNVLRAERLRPKPEPDSVLEACRRLGVRPQVVATFETTPAGVAAGRAAGVDRVILVRREDTVRTGWSSANGVVSDLAELIDPALG